jgi:hypothetical protein
MNLMNAIWCLKENDATRRKLPPATSNLARSPFNTTAPGTTTWSSFIDLQLVAFTSLIQRTSEGFAFGFSAANLASVDCLMILTF